MTCRFTVFDSIITQAILADPSMVVVFTQFHFMSIVIAVKTAEGLFMSTPWRFMICLSTPLKIAIVALLTTRASFIGPTSVRVCSCVLWCGRVIVLVLVARGKLTALSRVGSPEVTSMLSTVHGLFSGLLCHFRFSDYTFLLLVGLSIVPAISFDI